MLTSLLDGRAMAAGELARAANVSAQSASMHLSQLLDGGLVKVAQNGRHRYYQIASPEAAHAVEALGVIASPRKPKPMGEGNPMYYAPTCYDHLAGVIAVELAEPFQQGRYLLVCSDDDREYDVTAAGEEFLKQWRIDVSALRSKKRALARRCLDWTERRGHVAGALGAALCQTFLNLRWMARDRNSRIVRVTPSGRRQLEALIRVPAAA